jgi:hypothetical protein
VIRRTILGVAAACAVVALGAPAAQAAVELNLDSAVSVRGDVTGQPSNDNAQIAYGVLPGPPSYRVTASDRVFLGDVDDQTTCTVDSPQQVTCQLASSVTRHPSIYVDLLGGNDQFSTTGAHNNHRMLPNGVYSGGLQVRGGDGDDTLNIAGNASVDGVNCGAGNDTAFKDPIDMFISADGSGFPPPAGAGCEAINPGSGGGGGGGCVGLDCFPGGPGPGPEGPHDIPGGTGDSAPPTLLPGSLKVRGGQTLKSALKGGLKVKVKTTASAKVGAKLTLAKKYAKKYGLGKKAVVIAKGSKTVGPQGGTVRLVFTQKAKRALSKVRSSLRAKLSVTVAGELAATEGVKLNTPERRRFH